MTSRERDLRAAFAEAISEVGIEGLKATSLFGSQLVQVTDRIKDLEDLTDPHLIWEMLDNVHDEETSLDDYARAVSRVQRAALASLDVQPPTVQGAARVPEIAALIEKSEALRDDVTGRVDAFGERIGTAQPRIGFGAKQWADFITALRAIAEAKQ